MERNDLVNLADDVGADIEETTPGSDEKEGGVTFVLSSSPIVPTESQTASHAVFRDYENLGELPHSYGRPLLVAIARDPHTLFAYWDIDWPAAFGDKPPADRKVHLRVLLPDGTEEIVAVVEPFAGSHLIPVSQPRGSYRIELGYHEPAGVWNTVAISEPVATPPDDVLENGLIDVATVPFHLSFQRIVDAFRGSKYDGDALAEVLGRLQERADNSEAALADVEREILRALNASFSETEALQRSRLRNTEDAFSSRERIESILGFGATSPMNGSSRV